MKDLIMEENKKIIEISGVKMEVDLRYAKTIDTYKVGDNVKILIKDYSGYKSHVGVIIAFDEYKNLPTIVIAYLEISYNSAEIKLTYINSATEDTEVTSLNKWDIPYSKADIIAKMDKEIGRKQLEISELETKKQIFIELFGAYFKFKE